MKKIISIVITVILLSGSMAVFADGTPSEWAVSEVGTVFPGLYESLQIDLDYQRDISRAEFSMLAFMVYKELSEQLPSVEVEQKFTDIGTETVDAFIPLANAFGIVNGVSDKEFAPRNSLTRQELCTMIYRVFLALDENIKEKATAANGNADSFADRSEIAEWALDAMEYSVYIGIVKGTSETTLSPVANVTVEQAMAICNRIILADQK